MLMVDLFWLILFACLCIFQRILYIVFKRSLTTVEKDLYLHEIAYTIVFVSIFVFVQYVIHWIK